ncbi:MAG: DUF5696 domain-containing protein [Fervidobacterium sp.]|uniref:DUF5696 domain-containing protein n=1 Tax=Fervidobacterium sp. TaxID=1871331 RepID=UPI00404A523F
MQRLDKYSAIRKIVFKSLLVLMIVVLIAFLIKSGPDVVTQVTQKSFEEAPYRFHIPDYSLKLENNILSVGIDPKSLAFVVEDKRNGAIWESVMPNEDSELNQTWNLFFNSSITVEFYDSSKNVRRAYLTRDGEVSKYSYADSSLTAQVRFGSVGISFDVICELVDDSLRISVDNIKEGEYKILGIYAYPYIGASKGTVSGSFLVADGVGAKIDLSKITTATAPLKMRMYGEDIGFQEVIPYKYFKNVKSPENYALPIYGIIYNEAQNSKGILGVIEEGDFYTEINAYRAGIVTPYNWISPRIVLRDMHKKLLNKAGEGITIPQEEINTTSFAVRYFFISQPSEYSIEYSLLKRFVEEYVEKKAAVESRAPMFKFDILMSEAKKSTFGYSLVEMTTEKDLAKMRDMLNKISEENIFVLHGYSNGGLSINSPIHIPFEKRVIDNAKDLSKDYFYVEYISVPKESKSVRKNYVAQNRLEQLMEYENSYIILPYVVERILREELTEFSEYGISNFAIGTFGKLMFSTYTDNRQDVFKVLNEAFSKMSKPIVYGTNWYATKVAGMISDVPLSNSMYEIEDEEFPIVPYILRHFGPVFSKPLNLSSDYNYELLKCIEYSVLPSFYLTWENSEKLVETQSRDLISTKFTDWYEKIKEARELYSKALGFFLSVPRHRQEISKGVYKVTYENETVVVFNYTDKVINVDGITVEPMSFAVINKQ